MQQLWAAARDANTNKHKVGYNNTAAHGVSQKNSGIQAVDATAVETNKKK